MYTYQKAGPISSAVNIAAAFCGGQLHFGRVHRGVVVLHD